MVKSESVLSLQKIGKIIVIPLALSVIFAVGCASKTGVTKTSNENTPPHRPTPAVTPTPTPPPEETVTKPKTNEENVNGNESSTPVKTEEIAEIGSVYFDFDKYDLSDAARTTLAKNATWLKKNNDIKLRVEGNCDERGTVEYNLALGEKRANATKDYYVSLGINAGRIQTISYGKEKPRDPGHTEEAWSKNRRADTVKVLPN